MLMQRRLISSLLLLCLTLTNPVYYKVLGQDDDQLEEESVDVINSDEPEEEYVEIINSDESEEDSVEVINIDEPEEEPVYVMNNDQTVLNLFSLWSMQFRMYAESNNNAAHNFALVMGLLTRAGLQPLTLQDIRQNYWIVFSDMALNASLRQHFLALFKTTGLLQHTQPTTEITTAGAMMMTVWGNNAADSSAAEFADWSSQQSVNQTNNWLDDFIGHMLAFLDWFINYLQQNLQLPTSQ